MFLQSLCRTVPSSRARDAGRDDRTIRRCSRAGARPRPAGTALVARRRRLPGLRPELRRRGTATGSAISPVSAPSCRTCASSASTRSGSTPGTRRRSPTTATTSSTTARSTPRSGRSTEAEELIAEARELGIRTIVDVVPNHVSSEHRWFRGGARIAARLAGARAVLVSTGPGRGRRPPPNGWQSIFGGSAWTRSRQTASGTCTSSRPSSPISTGRTRTSGPSTRTCCASGSTVASPACASTRRRCSSRIRSSARRRPIRRRVSTPSWIATSCTRSTARWRAIADSYDEPRVLVGEIWLPDAERLARYLRPDELHTAFNFDFLACPWEPGRLRASIESALAVARARRRTDDLGALQPRRHAAGHALRARRHVVLVRGEARGNPDRSRARHAPRPRGRAALDGAARLDVRLPGRGARTARGRGHPGRAPA